MADAHETSCTALLAPLVSAKSRGNVRRGAGWAIVSTASGALLKTRRAGPMLRVPDPANLACATDVRVIPTLEGVVYAR